MPASQAVSGLAASDPERCQLGTLLQPVRSGSRAVADSSTRCKASSASRWTSAPPWLAASWSACSGRWRLATVGRAPEQSYAVGRARAAADRGGRPARFDGAAGAAGATGAAREHPLDEQGHRWGPDRIGCSPRSPNADRLLLPTPDLRPRAALKDLEAQNRRNRVAVFKRRDEPLHANSGTKTSLMLSGVEQHMKLSLCGRGIISLINAQQERVLRHASLARLAQNSSPCPIARPIRS